MTPAMDMIGKSPIPVPYLILGKIALAGSVVFPFLKSTLRFSLLYDGPAVAVSGLVLYFFGVMVVVLAITRLGRSIAVGLPERETRLMTGGLYRYSRNPIYTGAFIVCLGSCLYALHIANIICFAATLMIHTMIILKEEEFLDARFGEEWRVYRSTVGRFFGRRS